MAAAPIILLCDVGNTHTHLGVARGERIVRQLDIQTTGWFDGSAAQQMSTFLGEAAVAGAVFCSVVPDASSRVRAAADALGGDVLELNARTVRGIGIDYPRPRTIGPDRLANAVAARHHFGAPAVVVDFGTAVTFDVVDKRGNYVGGIIAPGLAAMTDYLHEKTALLPRIRIRDTKAVIGKSTEQAMLVGAVHGYRGLICELIVELKRELAVRRLPVVATGGCARLIASGVREITKVDPLLTLEGLRLVWKAHFNLADLQVSGSTGKLAGR